MNQNTTINPRSGLKIANPCFYDITVTARVEQEITSLPAEQVVLKEKNATEVSFMPDEAVQGNQENAFARTSFVLLELLLCCIMIPLAAILYAAYRFVWPVFKGFCYLIIIGILAKR